MNPSDYYENGWPSVTKRNSIKAAEFTYDQVVDWLHRYHEIFSSDVLQRKQVLHDALFEMHIKSTPQRDQLKLCATVAAIMYSKYVAPDMKNTEANQQLQVTAPKVRLLKATERVPLCFVGTPYSILGVGLNEKYPGFYDLYVRSSGKIIAIPRAEELIKDGLISITMCNGLKYKNVDCAFEMPDGVPATPRQVRVFISWAIEADLYKPRNDIPKSAYVEVKDSGDSEDDIVHEHVFGEGVTPFTSSVAECNIGKRPSNKVDAHGILAQLRSKVADAKADMLSQRKQSLDEQRRNLENLLSAQETFAKAHPHLKVTLDVIKQDLNNRITAVQELQEFLNDGTLPSFVSIGV